jgi:hypothetical protein
VPQTKRVHMRENVCVFTDIAILFFEPGAEAIFLFRIIDEVKRAHTLVLVPLPTAETRSWRSRRQST